MYADDLKIAGEREEMIQKQLQIFKTVSDDIRKAPGPVKCENVALKMQNCFTPNFCTCCQQRNTTG
jgi:hypothetical protein